MPDHPTAEARDRTPALTQALTSTALMEQAHDALQRKLAVDPRDQGALLGLGDLLRRAGRFPQAIAAYRTLHQLRGDAASAWLIGALGGGEPLGAAPEGHHAAPFVRRTNFLGPAEREKLHMALDTGPDEFKPAKAGRRSQGDEWPEYRTALTAKPSTRRKIRQWFVPRLQAVLADAASHLGVSSCTHGKIEIDLTATVPGGFYRAHRDNAKDPENPNNTRLISYVYYCHRQPKPFAGGELLLYDTCIATKRFSRQAFSRIDPTYNTLVLFPSCYYHEILPVHSSSGRFQDARFTVNGWVHSSRAAAAPCDETAA